MRSWWRRWKLRTGSWGWRRNEDSDKGRSWRWCWRARPWRLSWRWQVDCVNRVTTEGWRPLWKIRWFVLHHWNKNIGLENIAWRLEWPFWPAIAPRSSRWLRWLLGLLRGLERFTENSRSRGPPRRCGTSCQARRERRLLWRPWSWLRRSLLRWPRRSGLGGTCWRSSLLKRPHWLIVKFVESLVRWESLSRVIGLGSFFQVTVETFNEACQSD